MYVSEDVGSTSICVVSGATEELTAYIEDRSIHFGGKFGLDSPVVYICLLASYSHCLLKSMLPSRRHST